MTGTLLKTPLIAGDIDLVYPAAILDVDASHRFEDYEVREGQRCAWSLVRFAGRPVGAGVIRITDGYCRGIDLARFASIQLGDNIIGALLAELLREPLPDKKRSLSDLLSDLPQRKLPNSGPLVTVAVCTRNRTEELARCLTSIERLTYRDLDLLVVDNSPATEATRLYVESVHPRVRYIREDRPGLDRARNRALIEAKGSIVAFTDDDAVVDPEWISRLVRVFETESAWCVTGLIAPLELRTQSQVTFEALGGFGRGYVRAWYRADVGGASPDVFHIGAGRFGAGANMAFSRRHILALGGFDPALDVGTPTEGGGDLEAFFRILQEGGVLVYEPAAVVWHGHRMDHASLAAQIGTWGTAMTAFLTAGIRKYPNLWSKLIYFSAWWLWQCQCRLMRGIMGASRIPIDVLLKPVLRSTLGPFQYVAALRQVEKCDQLPPHSLPELELDRPAKRDRKSIALRSLDLANGVTDIDDVTDYKKTQVVILAFGSYVGTIRIVNNFAKVTAEQLRYEVAHKLSRPLIKRLCSENEWEEIIGSLMEWLEPITATTQVRPRRSVSVVLATCDRPVQLKRALQSLVSQEYAEPVEIVVVDNHPASRQTPPVVKDFPGVVLVEESQRGLAAARNAGILASQGDIIVTTDDDVVAPSGWLCELISAFRRADVAVVTGNVLPLKLEMSAERLFESIGGLGRGDAAFEAGLTWLTASAFRAAPVWNLGATANAAFRRSLFQDPEVGLFDERLGPGTVAGVGEDSYLIYKALRAGYRLSYVPSAAVFHEHRKSIPEFRTQMFNYSKGHVSYLLTTLMDHGDFRALTRLLGVLPFWHCVRIFGIVPRLNYSRRLALVELAGYFSGPLAWWFARRRAIKTRSNILSVQGMDEGEQLPRTEV